MRGTVHYLTEEEAERIEAAAQGKPCKVGVMLALHYGLRLSDITHLRWEDIDTQQRTMCIDNGKGYRVLRLTVEDAAYLHGLETHRNGLVSPFVWVDVPGVPAAPYGVTRAIRRHCAACGVPGVGLRELRHTAIVRKLREGMRMDVLQEWAGYSEYSAAFLIYADVIRQIRNRV